MSEAHSTTDARPRSKRTDRQDRASGHPQAAGSEARIRFKSFPPPIRAKYPHTNTLRRRLGFLTGHYCGPCYCVASSLFGSYASPLRHSASTIAAI